MKNPFNRLFGAGLLAAVALVGQQIVVNASRADLTTPTGLISGQIVVSADQMVFTSEGAPTIVVPRGNIQSLGINGDTVTVQLRSPIRDYNRLVLRMSDPQAGNATV